MGQHLVETSDDAKAALDWPKDILESVVNVPKEKAGDTEKDDEKKPDKETGDGSGKDSGEKGDESK